MRYRGGYAEREIPATAAILVNLPGAIRVAVQRASTALSAAARQALGIDTAPALGGLRDVHRTNLAAHRARHGF